jgi:hypothetical protein
MSKPFQSSNLYYGYNILGFILGYQFFISTSRLYPLEIFLVLISVVGTRWRSCLRHCATSRKVAGSIPDGVIEIFNWHNPSGHTMALGSTQALIEMSTTKITWKVKAAGA